MRGYKYIPLSPIKHKKIKISCENPNLGVIDLETFENDNGVTKVYCAGFKP